ncbi:hypothetical protein [Jiangella alba]|nr:hypothetical protein [Jiangella alba]
MRVLGNGAIVAHLDGAQLTWCVGPEFTMPTALSARYGLPGGGPLTSSSTRAPRSMEWTSTLTDGPRQLGAVHDTVTPSSPCYVADVELTEPVELRFEFPHADRVVPEQTAGGVSVLARIDRFGPVFVYPAGAEAFAGVHVSGTAPIELRHDGGSVTLALAPGSYTWQLLLGRRLSQVLAPLPESARSAGARATAHYRRTVATVLPGGERLDALLRDHGVDCPPPGEQLIDASAYLITAQQSAEGAVIAGPEFPLAYLRDSYGVSRALLDLGLHDRAARLARFRVAKWQRFGDLANAESIGHDRIRHRHENDDAEAPGYAMLQVLDALAPESVDGLGDLLDWCWRAQVASLRDGVVPFNGDETYVAGGFLDRSFLRYGSFESTLVMIRSGERYAEFLTPRDPRRAAAVREVVQQTMSVFAERFGGPAGWLTAARVGGAVEERHGVCEACHDYPTWLVRNSGGRFVCVRCRDADLPPAAWHEVSVPTAQLLPALLPGPPVPHQTLIDAARVAAGVLLDPGARSNGHDVGMCLMALPAGDPHVPGLLRQAVERFDRDAGWPERFRGDQPDGSRRRPWETALNLLALRTLADRHERTRT